MAEVPKLRTDLDCKAAVNPLQDSAASLASVASDVSPTTLPPEKWYKSRTFRIFVIRVVLRLVALAIFITILRIYGAFFRWVGNAYLDWIQGLGFVTGPVVFLIVAIAFCAVSPTGYLPSVMAGITFPYAAAIPISYLCVILGASLNIAAVRGLLFQWKWLDNRCSRKGGFMVAGLERALAAQPIRIVALLRFPFLGNGTLNYILSFRRGSGVGVEGGCFIYFVCNVCWVIAAAFPSFQ
jgi:hypothetical protein